MLIVLGPQMVGDGCHHEGTSGVIINVWPFSDSSEKRGVLQMPSKWVFIALPFQTTSPDEWLFMSGKAAKRGAAKITNDSTLFTVGQGNIFSLMFSGENQKLGLRDSYARCQPSVRERSIKWNKMWSLWKWSQCSGKLCEAHLHS